MPSSLCTLLNARDEVSFLILSLTPPSSPSLELGRDARCEPCSLGLMADSTTIILGRRHSPRQTLVTRRNLESLQSTYKRILREAGVTPRIVDPHNHLSPDEVLGHCLWILEEKIGAVVQRIGGLQEAIRLLGCIQGTVMALGLCTIAETREHANRATLTTWDKILRDHDHGPA